MKLYTAYDILSMYGIKRDCLMLEMYEIVLYVSPYKMYQ